MSEYLLYNGTKKLIFNETLGRRKHVYTLDGDIIESVTTILNIISKPNLVQWAAKMAGEYIEANLKPGQALDELQIKDLAEAAKSAHRLKKESAATIGTLVHGYIEDYIKLGKDKAQQLVNPQAKAGVDAFNQWIDEHKVEFHHSEKKVLSLEHRYAGTLDFIATVDGKRVLGDIKTSSGIYPEMFLQTSAYQLAIQEELKDEVFEGHLIVNCKKDGTLDTAMSEDYAMNIQTFLHALGLHRGVERLKYAL